MKQKELAEKVGIAKTYMSMIEAGKSRISVDLLFKIAAALEVHPQALLEDNEKRVFRHSLKKLQDSEYMLNKMRAELDGFIEKYKIKLNGNYPDPFDRLFYEISKLHGYSGKSSEDLIEWIKEELSNPTSNLADCIMYAMESGGYDSQRYTFNSLTGSFVENKIQYKQNPNEK
jgi:transcriptional regulator with XRE-family HTH domain